MPACFAYNAYMKKIQYTIRGISERTDRILREKALKEGVSLNAELNATLEKAAGNTTGIRYDDLDSLAGTWVQDPEFDRAIEEMDRIDEDLWK